MRTSFDPDRVVRLEVGAREVCEFTLRQIMVPPGTRISLRRDYDPGFTGGLSDRRGAEDHVEANVERLHELQAMLSAQDAYAVLLVLQGMDTSGKDGVIRHVMSGVNPQGCEVTAFKAPSAEELDHDYLWRAARALPARGTIGIFNRSYYEEVLVVRVHPEHLDAQRIPRQARTGIWEHRFEEIRDFERYLERNGIVIVKCFLNISKKEQKKRFLARIENPEKNWKFSIDDYRERGHWDDYQEAYEDMLNHTSTEWAPWLVIAADNKWFARLAVSEAMCQVMERLDLHYPRVTPKRRAELLKIKRALEEEE